MNKLRPEQQKQIIASLIEGNSIRATCRMTDTAKGTVLKLLADIGKHVKDTKIRLYVIFLVKESNVMKYGHSATQKKRMCQGVSDARKVT